MASPAPCRSRPAAVPDDCDEKTRSAPSAATARDRALRLLASRDRSSAELSRRLTEAGFGAEEVDDALESLRGCGLLDDARFARQLVRDLASRRLLASRVLRASLLQKGIDGEVADVALEEAGDEADRARALAEGRASRLRALPPEVAFRRLYAVLLRRGYPPGLATETCREALRHVFGDRDDPRGED